jgi:hypothetical protein
METSKCLDDLIECLLQVLKVGQGSSMFLCREKCVDCLTRLVGADHYYTQCFKDFVRNPDELSVLAASGLLNAVKEEIAKREERNIPAGDSDCRNTGFELESQP